MTSMIHSCRCSLHANAQMRMRPSRARSVRVSAKKDIDEGEEKLEAYEQYLRSGKRMNREEFEKIAERRQSRTAQQQAQVVWREGALFPEGWDDMDPFEKMTQLYMGERGLLFWANKAAYASVFILGGAWVLFRFVGPALGLYELAGNVPQP